MTDGWVIRPEAVTDAAAISAVTAAAFATLEISDHTEQFVIDRLRAAGALSISLVAVLDGRVVGHIAFSRVAISDGTPGWFGLGPVSVLPGYQRRGIGGSLIREGLSLLPGTGARGCCLVGHPGYYGRFGFVNTPDLSHEGVPPEAFFALTFDGRMPRGTVSFHDAFRPEGSPDAE
jgi:putative acetyltransferase